MSVKKTLKKASLTIRQEQILAMLASGRTYPTIARQTGLARSTISGHAARIFKSLGVNNRTSAVQVWRRGIAKDSRIRLMREARRDNEVKIQLLQELVKLQTEAIELMLQ
jgi:DNA-binding CsgD family transcriptional regulator